MGGGGKFRGGSGAVRFELTLIHFGRGSLAGKESTHFGAATVSHMTQWILRLKTILTYQLVKNHM